MKNSKLFWAQLITGIDILIAALFSIAALIDPASLLPTGYEVTESAKLFSFYYAGRSIPIALIGLIAIFRKNVIVIVVIGVLAGIVQIADACIGIYRNDLFKILGPLFLGVVQFIAIYPLYKEIRSAQK